MNSILLPGQSTNNGHPQAARKEVKKVVHSDAPHEEAPDPRWAGELAKLKEKLSYDVKEDMNFFNSILNTVVFWKHDGVENLTHHLDDYYIDQKNKQSVI